MIPTIGGDDALDRVVKMLLGNDAEALRMQKQLLQLWEEAPLAASIEKSIELFARSKLSPLTAAGKPETLPAP